MHIHFVQLFFVQKFKYNFIYDVNLCTNVIFSILQSLFLIFDIFCEF